MQKRVNTAVILAAGRGSRFGNRTETMPKGFVKVGKIPIIERSIGILKMHRIEHIILGCGHQKQYYEGIQKKYGLTIYCNDDYSTTESLHTLVLSKPHVSNDFLLLESDLLYEQSAIEKILEDHNPNVILSSGFTNSRDEVYVLADDKMHLTALTKAVSAKSSAKAEFVGISKLSLPFFNKLVALHSSASQYQTAYYEDGIVEVSKQNPVFVKKCDDLAWCEIDDETHLERAINHIFPKIQKAESLYRTPQA